MPKFVVVAAMLAAGLFLPTYGSELKSTLFAKEGVPFQTDGVLAAALTNATISESTVPDTGVAAEKAVAPTPPQTAATDPISSPAQPFSPAHLSIPSIKLAATIQPVGTDPDGKMSVPTIQNAVGWYKDGTLPGDEGSAVFDAHVYLAFKNLKNVKPGSDIYVIGASGARLHFVVSSAKTYAYNRVPIEKLFGVAVDGQHLNLITCAGTWLPKAGTYSQRLVLYANLVT